MQKLAHCLWSSVRVLLVSHCICPYLMPTVFAKLIVILKIVGLNPWPAHLLLDRHCSVPELYTFMESRFGLFSLLSCVHCFDRRILKWYGTPFRSSWHYCLTWMPKDKTKKNEAYWCEWHVHRIARKWSKAFGSFQHRMRMLTIQFCKLPLLIWTQVRLSTVSCNTSSCEFLRSFCISPVSIWAEFSLIFNLDVENSRQLLSNTVHPFHIVCT